MQQRVTLTLEQAARWLGVEVAAANELVAAGSLPSFRIGERIYIRRGAIDALRASTPSVIA